MEILNQLLSNRTDYLNALRNAQQMPVAPQLDSGDGPKFKIKGKFIVQVLVATCVIYVGYRLCINWINDPSDNDE